MRYFIDERRCDSCQICVSACPTGAVQIGREWPSFMERVRTSMDAPKPIIDQDNCDGCESRLVPPCIAVCDIGAIRVNMLV